MVYKLNATSHWSCSEEESHNFPSGVLALGLLVVHDAVRCGENQMTKLTRRQDISRKLLNVAEAHVESRGDGSNLVDAPNQINHDFTRSMIVNDLHVPNVLVLLHHLQELDNHLGARAAHDLPLPAFLCIQHAVEAVTEHTDTNHDGKVVTESLASKSVRTKWLE